MTNYDSIKASCIWRIQVRCNGHFDSWIKDYFGELSITLEDNGTTLIMGEFIDLSAVYGFILQLRDIGIFLESLKVEKIK